MLGALVLAWSIKGENILSFLCKSWGFSQSFEAGLGARQRLYKGTGRDSWFRLAKGNM